MTYWKGWPGKCPYMDDLNWACKVSISYLTKVAPKYKTNGRTGLVIFDLDETLFMGDPDNALGHEPMSLGNHPNPKNNNKEEVVFILPPNNNVKQIATTAKKLGFKVICLTARPPESHLASVANLKMFEIPHDCIIMNDNEDDPYFKVNIRRKLALKPNQDIVMTIGDQFTDCFLPGSNTCAIKLPDPESKCAYAYIPK